jgi:uncharacterized protein YajQ (UPF0234 family)
MTPLENQRGHARVGLFHGKCHGGPGRIRTFVGCAGRFTVCSLWPLGYRPQSLAGYRIGSLASMPSFDVVSEVDRQELRNAVDQAQREMSQRFDFKGTNSEIEQNELVITIRTISEDKARAVRTLLEEKFVKRGLSLKGIEWGKFEQASGDSVRQVVTIKVGISSDKAKEINKMIKEKGPKGVSSQTQGEQVRVTSKKRDDLQEVITLLKGADLGIPLQFDNFRD